MFIKHVWRFFKNFLDGRKGVYIEKPWKNTWSREEHPSKSSDNSVMSDNYGDVGH